MKTAELTLSERTDLAIDWFLNSGIQSEDGGFYAWQDVKDGSHPYLYSEITGYAITLMSFLYTLTKNDIFIERARHAAQWILQDAPGPGGSVLTRKYLKDAVEHYSFERGNIYSFDCAMVAFGMLKLYKISADEDYLACAQNLIGFLNNKMLKNSGLYYPVFDTKKESPYEDLNKWSTQSGSFHAKIVLCLCELASIKNEGSYSDLASKLIDSSIKNFYKAGRFITGTLDGTSHFHPYCYTLEGMLYYSRRLKNDKYKNVIEDAFDWISGFQQEDGGFPTEVFDKGKMSVAYQRSDIQSQVLRLSYFIASDIDRECLIERFLKFQNIDKGSQGGFLFGADRDGTARQHSNAWCSMFALQALYLASGKAESDIIMDYLV